MCLTLWRASRTCPPRSFVDECGWVPERMPSWSLRFTGDSGRAQSSSTGSSGPPRRPFAASWRDTPLSVGHRAVPDCSLRRSLRACSLGASPLHHQPTGNNLFRDPPEKLAAKLYETDLRKAAEMGAQPVSSVGRVVGGPGGLPGRRSRRVEELGPAGCRSHDRPQGGCDSRSHPGSLIASCCAGSHRLPFPRRQEPAVRASSRYSALTKSSWRT